MTNEEIKPAIFQQIGCDIAFIVALPEEERAIDIFEDTQFEPVPNDRDLDIRKRKIDTARV